MTVPWPQSRRRRSRKEFVALFGRKRPSRPAGWQPKPTRVPAYTRPGVDERLQYLRFSERGWSARKIARRFRRDHHTVLRAREPRRVERLAADLVFDGRHFEAVDLVVQIGDPELLAWIKHVLPLVLPPQSWQMQKLNETLRDAL